MSTAMMTRPISAGTAPDNDWIELEDFITADSLVCVAPAGGDAPAATEFIELEPPMIVGSQDEMRFGARTYTTEQAHVIELAVRRRRPLGISPLPIDD
jgi:hypothetical protein